MTKTMIISTFPACGKTWLAKNYQRNIIQNANRDTERYTCLEIDSSQFSRDNDKWYEKYVDAVQEAIGKYDFIFVSMQDVFLEELHNRNIPFVVVAPNNSQWVTAEQARVIKQQWFGRFLLRDNSHIKDFNSWLNKLITKYDEWTSIDCLSSHSPADIFLLNQDEYLSSIISKLYFKKEHYPDIYDANKINGKEAI